MYFFYSTDDFCKLLSQLKYSYCAVSHLLCLSKMQQKIAGDICVELPDTDIPFEFPYLKIQDKANYLRWSLVLPMLG